MTLRVRISWLLNYEPTWFPEVASGFAILGWSIAAFITDEYLISGGAWIMPCIGLVFGPARWVLLFRLWWGPRSTMAAAGVIWWGWIMCASAFRWGVVPMMGPIGGMLLIDLLTLGRFSIPAFKDIVRDVRHRQVA